MFFNAMKSELPLPFASTILSAKGAGDKSSEQMLDEKLTNGYVLRDGIAGLEWTEEFLPAAQTNASPEKAEYSEFIPIWKPGPDSEAT